MLTATAEKTAPLELTVRVPADTRKAWDRHVKALEEYRRARSSALDGVREKNYDKAVSHFTAAETAAQGLVARPRKRFTEFAATERDEAQEARRDLEHLVRLVRRFDEIEEQLAAARASLNSADDAFQRGDIDTADAELNQAAASLKVDFPLVRPSRWHEVNVAAVERRLQDSQTETTVLENERRPLRMKVDEAFFARHVASARKARAAFQYGQALKEATAALGRKPNDPAATALEAEAEIAVRYGQVFHHEGTTAVRHLAFDRDGRRLTAVHEDGAAAVWNLETTSADVAGSRTVAASPASMLTAGGTTYIAFDKELLTVKLWDLTRPMAPFRQLDGEQQGTTAVARSPDGGKLVTGNAAGTVYLWNLETRRKVATLFRSSKENLISALAYSPNGERLFVGNAAGEVAVLSATAPDQPAGKVKRLGTGTAKVVAIIVAAKEPHVVTLHANNELRWWPEGEGKTAAGETTSAAFTPDGSILLTGHTTGEVRVWNVATRQPADPLPLHQEQLTAVAAATEQLFATGTADGVMKIWDLRSRKLKEVDR
jgi:hypothetical protein